MNEDAARSEADRRNRERPDRHTTMWAARPTASGDWEVVGVKLPGASPRDLTPGVEARPHKPDPGQLGPPPQPNPYWGPG